MRSFEGSFSLKYWLNYIESLHPEEIALGLERVKSLAQEAGLLDFKCPVVLIGGTNGKGSTLSALATLLTESGLKVGSYFSPHLLYFNERIRIDGQCIQDYQLCQIFSKIEQFRISVPEPIPLTFFEFTTLAALLFFKESHCDIIVLEVGLGGRLDAVNIVEPTLSIITTIGFDHMDRLGDSLDKIAFEKAGILRSNKPAIIGAGACQETLLEEGRQKGSQLIVEGEDFGWKTDKLWHYQDQSHMIPYHKLPLPSLSLALAAFYYLQNESSFFQKEHCAKWSQVLMKAALPGRFQKYFNKVETILDVAHNPLGSQWLAQKLKAEENHIAVWSSYKDKDLKGIVGSIQEKVKFWVIAPLQDKRSASIEQLQQALEEQGVPSECIFCEETVGLAYKKAYSLARLQDKIIVFGSFKTVGEVMISLPMSLPLLTAR